LKSLGHTADDAPFFPEREMDSLSLGTDVLDNDVAHGCNINEDLLGEFIFKRINFLDVRVGSAECSKLGAALIFRYVVKAVQLDESRVSANKKRVSKIDSFKANNPMVDFVLAFDALYGAN
jgi:hypothetical protein